MFVGLPGPGLLGCVLRKHLGVGLILGGVPIQNFVFRNNFKQSYLWDRRAKYLQNAKLLWLGSIPGPWSYTKIHPKLESAS